MSQEYAGEGWGSRTGWFKSQKRGRTKKKEQKKCKDILREKIRKKRKRLEESIWLFDLRGEVVEKVKRGNCT